MYKEHALRVLRCGWHRFNVALSTRFHFTCQTQGPPAHGFNSKQSSRNMSGNRSSMRRWLHLPMQALLALRLRIDEITSSFAHSLGSVVHFRHGYSWRRLKSLESSDDFSHNRSHGSHLEEVEPAEEARKVGCTLQCRAGETRARSSCCFST